jgi:hypothetical protein
MNLGRRVVHGEGSSGGPTPNDGQGWRCRHFRFHRDGGWDRFFDGCRATGNVRANPLLKLLSHVLCQAHEADAAALLGSVRPNDLAICFDGRMAAGQGKFQTATLAFDDGANDLAAQTRHTEVEQDPPAVRSKTDVCQLIQPAPRVGAAFGRVWGWSGASGSGRHSRRRIAGFRPRKWADLGSVWGAIVMPGDGW